MSVDPSYMDFSGGSSYDPTSSWSSQYAPSAPTDTSTPSYTPSGDLSPVDTSQAVNQGRTNQLEAQHNINATDAASNADPGMLKGALSALGSKQGSALLSALTGILGAAGHYNQAKAYGKLPTMPSMGGLPTLPGMGGSTGYGPAGGYNYKNYAGLAAGAPGTGYAPRTQSPPPASYYTYGQGPEQQFFQQVNPQGGPIAPVTHKRGGKIKKYAMGGTPGPAMGTPPMPGSPPRPGTPPMPGAMSQPRPMMAQPVLPRPPVMPNPMQQRPGIRPFAAGGQTQGALSMHGTAPDQGSRYVRGPGDGTSDDIPARLANGEYVLSADVVSGLGNGDNNSGAKVLDGFVHNLRTHKAENASKGKLPADAKPMQHYMNGGK